MELVRGVPITDYCDQERLSIAERLELFVLVCRAVQHAHQKGIIHRDLKPSNILVTKIDGAAVPKVIDFGVAKATGQVLTDRTLFTSFHQFVGTPLYVSPEQAEFSGVDVDTRSDIYSLGVLLYELLTGTTPFDSETLRRAAFDEMRRIIREDEPPRPSTRLSSLGEQLSTVSAQRKAHPKRLGAAVKRELDWVVMKALEKDRHRRYETASDFAADVLRILTDRPVEACPPSGWYRMRKYARRHRAAMMTIGFVGLALVAGTGLSLWQAVRATRAERRSEERYEIARNVVNEMYSEVAEEWLDDQPHRTPTQEKFLKKALAYYQQFAAEQAADSRARAELGLAWYRVARIRGALGDVADAEAAMLRSLAIREALLEEQPTAYANRLALVESLNQLGFLLLETGRYDEATAIQQRSVALAEQLVADSPQRSESLHRLVQGLFTLAQIQERDAELAEVDALRRRVVSLGEELVRKHPEETSYRTTLAKAWNGLGVFLHARKQRFDEAQEAYEHAIEIFADLMHDEPGNRTSIKSLAILRANLGLILQQKGQLDTAESELKRARDTLARLVDDYPQFHLYRERLAGVLSHLGRLFEQTGRIDDAERAYRQAVEESETLVGESPDIPGHRMEMASALDALAVFLRTSAHRPLDAIEVHRRAVAVMEAFVERFPDDPRHRSKCAKCLGNLALALETTAQWAEAEDAIRRTAGHFEALADQFPNDRDYRSLLGQTQHNLGIILQKLRRLDEAEVVLERAIQERRSLMDKSSANPWDESELGGTLHDLASVKSRQADFRAALDLFSEAAVHQKTALQSSPDDPTFRSFLRNHLWGSAESGFRLGDATRVAEAAEALARGLSEDAQALALAALWMDRAAWLTGHDSALPTEARRDLAESRIERARVLLDAALSLAETDPEALIELSELLAVARSNRLRDPAHAVVLARQATEQAPQVARFWSLLALAQERAGDCDDACTAIARSRAIQPDDDGLNDLVMALALAHIGEIDQARQSYETALSRRGNVGSDFEILLDQLSGELADRLGDTEQSPPPEP